VGAKAPTKAFLGSPLIDLISYCIENDEMQKVNRIPGLVNFISPAYTWASSRAGPGQDKARNRKWLPRPGLARQQGLRVDESQLVAGVSTHRLFETNLDYWSTSRQYFSSTDTWLRTCVSYFTY
jgi:hypothetical protein